MTQPRGSEVLVEALRAAIEESAPLRAGRLRPQLESRLGAEQSRLLRREIHQVVAAAEEHLPTRLVRVTPLTPSALARISAELAAARDWSPATAERTTRTWAAALGFDGLAAREWPAGSAASPRPPVSVDPAIGVTARPPEAPARGPRPQAPPVLPHAARSAADVSWPTPAKRLVAAHARSTTGEPALGVTQAYAGVSLPAFTAVVVGLTSAVVAVALVLPGLAWLLAPVGAAAAAYSTRFLRYGALLATTAGLEFVPYDGNMRRPRPERTIRAAWPQVAGEVGTVSRLSAAGQRFQVGPRNRSFAAAAVAAATRTGGGPRDVRP
jgi:hypothetical protein